MKKITLIMLLIMFSANFSYGRIHPNALGLRLGGDGDVNGVEISYQLGMGKANRLELDLGFGSNKHHERMYVAGIYHWHWNIKGGLNWYAGPGASLGFYSNDKADDYINIGLGGQIGLGGVRFQLPESSDSVDPRCKAYV